MIYVFLSLFVLTSCNLHAYKEREEVSTSRALDEVRLEIGDLKHALHAVQTELSIIDEKIATSQKAETKPVAAREDLSLLQKKIGQLEKTQEKIIADLKQLNTHLSQNAKIASQVQEKLGRLELQIADADQRLDEVGKLSQTLSSISRAVSTPASSSFRTYKVKSGESLEKIARKEGCSVSEIRELNGLTHDRIVVGQELKLPK